MATIKEYFDKAFEQVLTATRRVSLAAPAWGTIEAVVQVHFDFDAPARYLSVFIPRNQHWKNVLIGLLNDPAFLLAPTGDVNIRLPFGMFVYGGFKVVNVQPVEIEGRPLCEAPIKATDLPYYRQYFRLL